MHRFQNLGSDYARSITDVVMGLLAFQFLTGMGLNLFVAFTERHPSGLSDAFGAMATGALSAVHLTVGFALPILSVVVMAILLDSGETRLSVFAAIGLASVAMAGISGMEFAYSGFDEDVYSYLMAVGFAAAFLSYSALLASHDTKS